MTRTRPFAQVDVFAASAYRGNPVAVVLEGADLDEAAMLQLAQWTNLSETTFVLPPSTPQADYRVRIFTPAGELPFAGHPTLGTAHAWLESGGRPSREGTIVQECAAGLIELRRGDTLAFAAPPIIRGGPIEEAQLEQLAAGLGVAEDDIVDHQWVDNGPGWAAVRLSSAEEVIALEPDLSRIPDAKLGVVGLYPEGAPAAYEVRAFVPGPGPTEDPVTGSLNASVAQWLTAAGHVGRRFRASQGRCVGREGIIEITAEDDGTVWVGGATATCIRGEIVL